MRVVDTPWDQGARGEGRGGGEGHAAAEGLAPGEQFQVLLAVQDLDTAITQLQRRKRLLPQRLELNQLQERMAELGTHIDDAMARRQVLLDQQAGLEEQIATLNARRQIVEERLYAARGTAPRELQALDEEVHHLAQRRSQFEETELEVLVNQEPIDAELDRLAADRAQLEEAGHSLHTAVQAAEDVIDTERSVLETSRGVQAARLPTSLADRYEVLRERLKGTGAARLIGNRCDGCHLELPAVEVERINRLPADAIVTCDQCGRILVRDGRSAPS